MSLPSFVPSRLLNVANAAHAGARSAAGFRHDDGGVEAGQR